MKVGRGLCSCASLRAFWGLFFGVCAARRAHMQRVDRVGSASTVLAARRPCWQRVEIGPMWLRVLKKKMIDFPPSSRSAQAG